MKILAKAAVVAIVGTIGMGFVGIAPAHASAGVTAAESDPIASLIATIESLGRPGCC